MPNQLTALWTYVRVRCGAAGGWDDAGTVVEKVILTAIFAALAIAVGSHHRGQGDGQGQLHQPELTGRSPASAWRTVRSTVPGGDGAVPMATLPAPRRSDEGSSVIEAVIVVPVVMLLLLVCRAVLPVDACGPGGAGGGVPG